MTHAPSSLTYGEAKIEQKLLPNIEGDLILPHKQQMNRKDAGDYYNAKLRKYWLDNLDDCIPESKKEAVLDYLLGKTIIITREVIK